MSRASLFAMVLLFVAPRCVVGAESLAEPRRLLLTGRYKEAEERFRQSLEQQSPAAQIGVARCLWETGAHADAEKLLLQAAKTHEDSAALASELAFQMFHRGRFDDAAMWIQRALTNDKQSLAARWIQAELFRATGKVEDASAAYRWLVDFYNAAPPEKLDSDALHWIGLAAAQHARWNRLSDQFRFLVNDLYPDALKLEKEFWPARFEAGLLFLEKYNEGDAAAELNAALAINPQAADVHAAKGMLSLGKFDLDAAQQSIDRALKINARCVLALQAAADLALLDARAADAITHLERAQQINPREETTLGRLASAYAAVDGAPQRDGESRFEKLVAAVTRDNPSCGEFFAALAGGFDLQRKFPLAGKYYAESQRRLPQLIHVPGELGMIQMRLGDETAAAKTLQHAFEIDPFNVRVRNSLEVLDLLQTYAVLETEHFVIRFDRGRDELLARWAAKYLEDEVYPEITTKLGFRPPGKSLFEIFNRAKNTSGHGWFSARMVGLPFIGTVGACAGKVVALASPNDMPKKFDWARVLRHEFVHVVNLQQTEFRIPHWFTEALAVLNEGGVRPPDWDQLLAKRLALKKLFNLDTINHGFARPKSGDDWTLAYYQASLYAEYMTAAHGADATQKLLAAYADNLTTRAALRRCFNVEQEQFETGYRKFVDERVAQTAIDDDAVSETLTELKQHADDNAQFLKHLEAAAKKFPRDMRFLKLLTRRYLEDENTAGLRGTLEKLSELDGDNPTYPKKLAQLAFDDGDWKAAVRWSLKTLHIDSQDSTVFGWLANSWASLDQHARAADAFEAALTLTPNDHDLRLAWARSLVKLKRNDAARAELNKLLADDPQDSAAKQLLESLAP